MVRIGVYSAADDDRYKEASVDSEAENGMLGIATFGSHPSQQLRALERGST